MNITQLGMVLLLLGSLRATMGHERVDGTIDNYIHPLHLSKDVRQCVDFIEREILGIKTSRVDIGRWKMGNKMKDKREDDKEEGR